MRFPRHAKVFRGPVDATPLAAVFFLLVIFLLLASLIYTPGVTVDLTSLDARTRLDLTVGSNGVVSWTGTNVAPDGLREALHAEQTNRVGRLALVVRLGPGGSHEDARRVLEVARDLRLDFAAPEIAVELPEVDGLEGTPNPIVVVAVNFAGQFFYENRLVPELMLKAELQQAVRDPRNPPTLMVRADRAVTADVQFRLGQIAREAGFREMRLAVQPRGIRPSPDGNFK